METTHVFAGTLTLWMWWHTIFTETGTTTQVVQVNCTPGRKSMDLLHNSTWYVNVCIRVIIVNQRWLPYKQKNQLMAYPFTVYIYHGFHRTKETSSWLTHTMYIFIMASIETEKLAHGLPIHCIYWSWLP